MSEITNKQQPQHLSRLVHVAKGTRYYDLQFEDGTIVIGRAIRH